MAEIKISNLAIATTLSANDRVVVLTNTNSTAILKTITANNFNRIITTAPTSNTSNGVAGQIAYDNTSFYVCTANNKWGKVSLTLSW
jgi:hypothetical protein